MCRQGIGSGFKRKLCVFWCAMIYFIWQDHNSHLHGGQARDPIILFQILRTCVRARAVSWREDVHDII